MITSKDAKPQWNQFTCGPAALRAALACYGDRVDGRKLAQFAETTTQGTDEHGLRVAAAEFGFQLAHAVYDNVDLVYVALLELLKQHTPVLLCVDGYGHWIVAVRGTSRHVWIVDPARDDLANLRRVTWRALLRRLHWGLPDEIRFDLYPVVPF